MLGGRYKKGNALTTEQALVRLGEMLKEKRLSLNISQKEVSEHSGVSLSGVRRIEAGESTSTKSLIQLMRSYEMLPELLSLYEEPELSLEDQWLLQEKKAKAKRKRASRSMK